MLVSSYTPLQFLSLCQAAQQSVVGHASVLLPQENRTPISPCLHCVTVVVLLAEEEVWVRMRSVQAVDIACVGQITEKAQSLSTSDVIVMSTQPCLALCRNTSSGLQWIRTAVAGPSSERLVIDFLPAHSGKPVNIGKANPVRVKSTEEMDPAATHIGPLERPKSRGAKLTVWRETKPKHAWLAEPWLSGAARRLALVVLVQNGVTLFVYCERAAVALNYLRVLCALAEI